MDRRSEEVIAGSEEVFADSLVAQDSADVLVGDSLDTVDPLDIIKQVPDSVEEVPDTVAEVPDTVEEVPDSIKEVPDVDKVVDCPRCGMFHTSSIFGEACYQARRNARRCASCGLLHEDYDIPARFFLDMDKFDCEFFIPDVEKLEMSGETIILPEQVVKKLEEMKQAKNSP